MRELELRRKQKEIADKLATNGYLILDEDVDNNFCYFNKCEMIIPVILQKNVNGEISVKEYSNLPLWFIYLIYPERPKYISYDIETCDGNRYMYRDENYNWLPDYDNMSVVRGWCILYLYTPFPETTEQAKKENFPPKQAIYFDEDSNNLRMYITLDEDTYEHYQHHINGEIEYDGLKFSYLETSPVETYNFSRLNIICD